MRDEDVRSRCFAALDVLRAQYGPDIPYSVLMKGFAYAGGGPVPFLNRSYGIYRSRMQRGNAALSINSSFKPKRYRDEETADGVLYHYQDGPIDNHYNAWLRNAYALRVPLVYFIGTRPNWYRPEYPAFVDEDDPAERRVLITFGKMRGPYDERESTYIDDDNERGYVVRQVKQRVHQAQFRGVVLPAYHDRCAICRLKEIRLLDAAHIVGDSEERGDPVVSNGLSLCTIHHRAFDQDLVGISPDYEVRVSPRLLDEEDGPMLEILKGSHGVTIDLPKRRTARPDPDRLAIRFEQFENSAST